MRIKKIKQTTQTNATIVNEYNTSTTDGYSCDYLNVKDITSKIIKNTSKVGTVYFMTAYQKGSRCYFSAQIDLLAEGSNLFTIDNSIKPKYTEIGNGINYQSGSSQPMIIKIAADSSTIDCNVYATAIKSYAAIHLEWEI